MTKLFSQDLGDLLVIGIQGDTKQEIEGEYYSLWNHGAVDCDLQWWTDSFGVCYIKERTKDEAWGKLQKAFFFSEIAKSLNSGESSLYKHKNGGIKEIAMQRAVARRAEITEEKFYF